MNELLLRAVLAERQRYLENEVRRVRDVRDARALRPRRRNRHRAP
jgi:hypothetical protein